MNPTKLQQWKSNLKIPYAQTDNKSLSYIPHTGNYEVLIDGNMVYIGNDPERAIRAYREIE